MNNVTLPSNNFGNKIVMQELLDKIDACISAKQEDSLHNSINIIENVTNSNGGFFHLVEGIDAQIIVLTAWTTKTEQFCKVPYLNQDTRRYHSSLAGIWARCLDTKKPMVCNDYSQFDIMKCGLPNGHFTLQRFISCPISIQGKIKAIIGVANKDTDYTKSDLEIVSVFGKFAYILSEYSKTEQRRNFAIANLSHHLRTPLNGLIGILELASERLTEEERDILNKCSDSFIKNIEEIERIAHTTLLDTDFTI